MDGSGKLLKSQQKLWQYFDVRCLFMPPSQGIHWGELTHQLMELIMPLQKETPQRHIYLCGESFGACLAMKVMEVMPNQFEKVILINSASAFYQCPWLNLGRYLTLGMPEVVYQASTLILLPFLAKLEAVSLKERQRLLQVMSAIPPSIVSWRIHLLENFFIDQNKLNLYKNKVQIIASAEDKLLPSVIEAERLNSIFTQSKITILPDSGHCCLLEKQVDLLSLIQT